jgi:two-component system sensor histidine kinase UhpB
MMTVAVARLLSVNSLRVRVLAAVGLTFVLSLASGAALAGLQARYSLKQELQAAMTGARQSVAEPFADLSRSSHARQDLTRLTEAFNGSRHLLVTTLGPTGEILSRSRPQHPDHAPPVWFARWMQSGVAPAVLHIPGGDGAVRIDVVEDNDVADAWSELRSIVAAFAVFSVIGASLIYLVIGAALSPLSRISGAFSRIGAGDYAVRIRRQGVAELGELTLGFNAMAERLADIDRRNRSLEEQLLTLQDEERAEIARDLHDEIGPYLFAVNLDASLAERMAREGRIDAAAERLGAIKGAVDHMQRQVRELLNQLRPAPAIALGLQSALSDAVDFWREKHPAVQFDLTLDGDDEAIEPRQSEALWRVTQEALSNAVRHARPGRIDVSLTMPQPGFARVRILDDGGAGPAEPRPGSGFGLRGMRERMLAAGGDLKIEATPGRGWTVEATAPARRASRSAAPSAREPA